MIGAVVGGALSLSTTLLVERQKRKAANDAEERRVLATAKLAARVIELEEMESVLRVSVGRTPFAWPPAPGFKFSTRAWDERAGELGALVPADQWDAVAAVYSTYAYSNLFGAVSERAAQDLLGQTKEAVRVLSDWRASAKFKRGNEEAG